MTAPFHHGLIVGKFYPPHLGHQHLIDTAAEQVEKLSVLVLGSSAESISLETRARWLSGIHAGRANVTVMKGPCDIPIDLESESIWAAHVALMQALLDTQTAAPVDAVFSSENYGPELARRFDATHVSVDALRVTQQVSASAIRADLAGSWDWLHPVVQAGLTTRVVFLGAESTGTTTISRAIAEEFRRRGGVWRRTQWVPEYGREVTIQKHEAECARALGADQSMPAVADVPWNASDFAGIAHRQSVMEESAARAGSPLLVCDTDALATTVWERRYLGPDSAASHPAAGALPARALYLLTDHHGVPFVQDGWRDGEHIRADMTAWFIETLTAREQSWVLLTGTLDQRIELARRVTEDALAATSQFSPPISTGRVGQVGATVS